MLILHAAESPCGHLNRDMERRINPLSGLGRALKVGQAFLAAK